MKHQFHTASDLPRYSVAEEKFNMYSHLLGILIGLSMVVISLLFSHSFEGKAAGLVFGSSLVVLYLASATYHGLPLRWSRAKQVFRVADHCAIYILIAGSCTPFILGAFQNAPPWQGWLLNLSLWLMALVGTILLIRDMERYMKLSILLYVLMGLLMAAQGSLLRHEIGTPGFYLFLAGGAIYAIGLALYSLKRPWTHAVFHVLCLIASSVHCVCTAIYII